MAMVSVKDYCKLRGITVLNECIVPMGETDRQFYLEGCNHPVPVYTHWWVALVVDYDMGSDPMTVAEPVTEKGTNLKDLSSGGFYVEAEDWATEGDYLDIVKQAEEDMLL